MYKSHLEMKFEFKGSLTEFLNLALILTTGSDYDFYIRTLTKKEVEKIYSLTGKNCTGYRHAIDDGAVRKILKKHSKDTKPIMLEDFENIPYFLNHYNRLSMGRLERGMLRLTYQAAFQDQNYFLEYVTEIRTGRKTLALISMYKI